MTREQTLSRPYNMKAITRLLTSLLIPALLSCTGSAREAGLILQGKVVAIKDGDTIVLLTANEQQETIRLAAIDCPEKSQPFGKAAKAATAALCFGRAVRVRCQPAPDRYGRTIGIIYVGDICVNEQLLRQGMAWHYRRYSGNASWTALEDSARGAHAGLWADPAPVAPWEWRKAKREGRLLR